MFAPEYLSITFYKGKLQSKSDVIPAGGIMNKSAHSMLRRIPIVAGIAVAIAAAFVAPSPAFAGGGTVMTSGQSGNHLYSATATVNVAPFPKDNKVVVIVNCQAEATPDASATTISTCSAGSIAAPAVSLPGDAVATGAVGIVPAGIQGYLCIGGSASFVEGTLGGSVVTGPQRCVTVSLSVGASATITG